MHKCPACRVHCLDLATAAAVKLSTLAYIKVVQHSAPPDSAAGLSSVSLKHFGTARQSIPHQVLLYFRWLPLYLQIPCHAVLPVASRCKGTRYQLACIARSYLMRPCTHRAWNQSVQCASCPGAATPGVSTFPRIVSSAITRCKGSQGRTSRNIRRTGTSTPGCRASPWKTRPLRHSCHSSQSWCASCFPIHPKCLCRQGKLRQLAQHSRLPSPQPHPARQQACPRRPGHSLRYQRQHQGPYSSCHYHTLGNN